MKEKTTDLNMSNSTLNAEVISGKTTELNISKNVINVNLHLFIQCQNKLEDKFGHIGDV